jgi:hypothetical protein
MTGHYRRLRIRRYRLRRTAKLLKSLHQQIWRLLHRH